MTNGQGEVSTSRYEQVTIEKREGVNLRWIFNVRRRSENEMKYDMADPIARPQERMV